MFITYVVKRYAKEKITVINICLPGTLILLNISSTAKMQAGHIIHTLTANSRVEFSRTYLSLNILKIRAKSSKTVVLEPINPKYFVNGTK